MQEGSKSRGVVESMTSQRGTSLPEPSQTYQPIEEIPYPVANLYNAAIEVLDEDRVSIVNENKDGGRIATDYVAGPSYSTALGILGSNSTRYKYLISIKKNGDGAKLMVTAFLESSGNEIQSWRDVSADNQTIVRNIQNALAEKIVNRAMK